MSFHQLLAGVLLLVLPGLSQVARAEGIIAYGCAECHGIDGNSTGPMVPIIAGQDKVYLRDVMFSFRDGVRYSSVMQPIANGLSMEDIEFLADYFSSQIFQKTDQAIDLSFAKPGAKLHNKYCEKCHEEGGRVASEAPRLAGQWMPYLQKTLDDFRQGRSQMPKKMAKKLEKLSDEDINYLVNFYGSRR